MFIITSSLSSTCTLFIHTNTHKFHPKLFFTPICHHHVSNHKNRNLSSLQSTNPSHFSYPRSQRHNHRSKMDFVVYSNDIQAGDLIPLGNTLFDSWTNWLPGLLLTIILPFFANKWGPFAKLKEKVDNAVDTAEEVVDAIEAVAEKVDKVAEDISDGLPEGGRFKKAADFIEDVAEGIAKDAHWVGDIIDKVEEVEEKVESLIETRADHQPTKAAKTGLPKSNVEQVDNS